MCLFIAGFFLSKVYNIKKYIDKCFIYSPKTQHKTTHLLSDSAAKLDNTYSL